MSPDSKNGEKSPLTAAQTIVEELTGMTTEHQSLALKFAVETLGLKFPSAAPQTPIPPAPATPAPLSSTQTPQSLPSGGDHSTDIRSFTEMKSPKSDQQFTAVVAYFYQFEARPEERKETINAETMKEAARLAGRAQVSKWGLTLNNAKNSGYLDPSGTGEYKISSVGENLVAITLPDGTTTTKPKRKTSTKKPTKKTAKKKASKKAARKKH